VALIYVAWRLLLDHFGPKYPDRTGNGIGAGTINTYDNRFLSIRLDEREANLEKLAAIDAPKLDDSITVTQRQGHVRRRRRGRAVAAYAKGIYIPKSQKVGFGELVVETKEKAELRRVPVIVKQRRCN
jgi:hypothetical protein